MFIQSDIDYLGKCIDILTESKDEKEVLRVHDELKTYVPMGCDSTQCDIIWAKAWKACPAEQVSNPPMNRIRQHDTLFCKMLMKKGSQ